MSLDVDLAVDLHDVQRHYRTLSRGVHAVDGVSLQVSAGLGRGARAARRRRTPGGAAPPRARGGGWGRGRGGGAPSAPPPLSSPTNRASPSSSPGASPCATDGSPVPPWRTPDAGIRPPRPA